MKKRIVTIVVAALMLCAFLVPASAFAGAGASPLSGTYRYFQSYDVKIVVGENNVLDITETIVCDYNKSTMGRGILRDIPTKLRLDLPDGTTKNYMIGISDVQVIGHKFTSKNEDGYRVLQIGDPNSYASGIVTYVIKYKYDLGDDGYEKEDFLYFNVIGTEWNADIESATFLITMPKPFDSNKVTAYSGRYGYKDEVELTIVGNTIAGRVENLGTNEGITIDVGLPEGYFVGERVGAPYTMLLLAAFVIIVVTSVALFLLFGRDGKIFETVEFTAPEGMTPAEVGYVIDGAVDNKDVTSLIIYWADKGYLSLSEDEDKDITIHKLKDLPEQAKHFEETMFNALFKNRDEVAVSKLKDTFYDTMETMRGQVKDSFKKNDIFTSQSMKMQGLVGFLTALPVTLSLFFTILYDAGDFMIAGVFSLMLLGLVVGPIWGLIGLVRSWRGLAPGKRMFRLLFSLILLGLTSLAYLAFMSLLFDSFLLGIGSMAATLVTAICAMFIRKRSPRGAELLGKILGLRNFIEKAEKDRIEMLVQQNPNYFYSILPFAYVLGVTNTWAKNFEKIGIQPPPPVWYYGYRGDVFTTMLFMNAFNRSMNSMNSSFVSRPAPKGGYSGGGGFGGGGGFSGGGFGGGGGGGW